LFEVSIWNSWLAAAQARSLDWHSRLRGSLPRVLEISDRVAAAWNARTDLVISHGDLEPYNVLDADSGLFLIDWESVGQESAGLELGRTLFAFGEHDLAFCGAALDSYVDASGQPPQIDDSFGLRTVARKLGSLTELVRVSIDAAAPTGWMQSSVAIPQAIEELLSMSSRAVDWSRRLAAARS
jgi:thiamine kinase-like enzyme